MANEVVEIKAKEFSAVDIDPKICVAVMRAAEERSKDVSLVDQILNPDGEKDAVKELVLATSRDLGDTLNEQDLEKALELVYADKANIAKRFGFVEPAHNLPYYISLGYIHSGKAGLFLAVPLLAFALYTSTINGIASAREKQIEQSLVVGKAELEKLYGNAKALAKEQAALQQAEDMYQQGTRYLQTKETEKVTGIVAQLGELEHTLTQEYKILVYGYVERTNDRNPHQKKHYARVEARASNGELVFLTIRDEEKDQMRSAPFWRERVPKSVYDRIKRDKNDNGVVDNNLFGAKEKGYLDVHVSMRGEDGQSLPRVGQLIEEKRK